MNLPIPNNHNAGSAVGAPPPAKGAGSPPPKTSTPDGDNALYRAMLAMTDELQTLSSAQFSVAKLSTALYDHMVPHTTDQLKDMQQELNDCSWLQDNFAAYDAYFKGKGPEPALGPGMTSGDLAKIKSFYQKEPKSYSLSNSYRKLSSRNQRTEYVCARYKSLASRSR